MTTVAAVIQAFKGGNDKAVTDLLTKFRGDPNSTDVDGRTPLSWAAGNGHGEGVAFLLWNFDMGLDRADRNDRTPLSWAAGSGHGECLELLLNSDHDPNVTDNDGRTPLSWAAANGHDECVELLLYRQCVDPNVADKANRTPLSWAAGAGHARIMKHLLYHRGIDLNIRDTKGRTPLFWAAESGRDQAVDLLIRNHRLDPNIRDTNGFTALSWAAKNGHHEVVKILLAARAAANLKSHDGSTAADLASEQLERQRNHLQKVRYRRVLELLNNPSPVQEQEPAEYTAPTIGLKEPLPSELDNERQKLCEYFKAHVSLHGVRTFRELLPNVNVWNLIYDSKWSDRAVKQQSDEWSWFHLPANNVSVRD
jgi:ankyrin repeat protein